MFTDAAFALNRPQYHPQFKHQEEGYNKSTAPSSTPPTSNMNGIGSTGGETIYGGGNTNMPDASNMPSPNASMARTTSSEVMEALRSGEPGAADKLMSKEHPKGHDGFLKRLKQKMGGGLKGEKARNGSDADSKTDLTKGTSPDDDHSVVTDPSVMSRDGGKGDGVIR